jgi:nucleolar protein 58
MLVLYESAAGYALFKVTDESGLSKPSELYKCFDTAEKAAGMVKLKAFHKFTDTAEAVAAASGIVESKLSKGLKKFLKKNVSGDSLAIADAKMGQAIKEKLNIQCVNDDTSNEILRGIRNQLQSLVGEVSPEEHRAYNLGLAHSLSRYKLKFSPDKVDTMIVQAINLLDELDKEVNIYAMRVREWYGWHFPEMGKIVTDNLQYARIILKIGTRESIQENDLSDIITEPVEEELKTVAEVSMGTEVGPLDTINIKQLCTQVVKLTEYRAQLFEYLKNRMNAIAPNLTVLVGELVGARLIAHAGSLLNLAKQPASTVQILGAEKALFRALKTKGATPKYGLIYHASLIGQAAPKFKGKISRVLAAKASLAIRYDALGEDVDAGVGMEGRSKVEARLRMLEGRGASNASGNGGAKSGKTSHQKYEKKSSGSSSGYNDAADAVSSSKKRSRDDDDDSSSEPEQKKKKSKKEKKEKKKKEKKDKGEKRKRNEDEDEDEVAAVEASPPKSEKKVKKAKSEKKKKKKKDSE